MCCKWSDVFSLDVRQRSRKYLRSRLEYQGSTDIRPGQYSKARPDGSREPKSVHRWKIPSRIREGW
jgi:hypothetical protein